MAENIDKDEQPRIPHAGGRPTLYRPEYAAQVEAEMAKGYSLGAFAGIIGVARNTLDEWAQRHPEFLGALRRGHAKRLLQWEKAGMTTAFPGAPIPGGKRPGKDGNPALIIFGLKNASRGAGGDDWGETLDIRQTEPIRAEIIVRGGLPAPAGMKPGGAAGQTAPEAAKEGPEDK